MNEHKNKRQIYLWEENRKFYDGLKNKSRLINLLLRKYREENEVDGESESESRSTEEDS